MQVNVMGNSGVGRNPTRAAGSVSWKNGGGKVYPVYPAAYLELPGWSLPVSLLERHLQGRRCSKPAVVTFYPDWLQRREKSWSPTSGETSITFVHRDKRLSTKDDPGSQNCQIIDRAFFKG